MRQVAKKISFTILKNYKKLTKKMAKKPKETRMLEQCGLSQLTLLQRHRISTKRVPHEERIRITIILNIASSHVLK